MAATDRFFALMAASAIVLGAIIWMTAARSSRKSPLAAAIVSAVVSAGGMGLAKYGAISGWPVAAYYGVPAAATIFLPPVYFHMSPARTAAYVILAFLSAPAIHFSALRLLGWDNYMPFLNSGA